MKEQLIEIFKKLDLQILEENNVRKKNGAALIAKSNITILGQTSLLAQPELTYSLGLAQTGDLDALIQSDFFVKKYLKEILPSYGFIYDEDSPYIFIPLESQISLFMQFTLVDVFIIDPESALVSKACKAPEKKYSAYQTSYCFKPFSKFGGSDFKIWWRFKKICVGVYMNQILIKKIKKAAEKDAIKRKDIRFKKAMAFLIKKGFLKANQNFERYYFAKVKTDDLIWAGKNVEPRILEVLPAAVARLTKAFKFDKDTKEILALKQVVNDLQLQKDEGHDFIKTPYAKMKVWMNFPLQDKRTKTTDDKKIMKTFRLHPQIVLKINLLKKKNNLTETQIIENLIENEVL